MYNYVKHWEHKITLEPKMCTYITFKYKCHYEDYLNLSTIEHRKAMTRIRISSLRLAIARGRYTTPVTPAEDRKWKLCNSQDIEDEAHLMLSCKYYKSLRDQLL